eukprot:6934233-Prymnesium_polylepis.1
MLDFIVLDLHSLGCAQNRRRTVAGAPHIVAHTKECLAGRRPIEKGPQTIADAIPECRADFLK